MGFKSMSLPTGPHAAQSGEKGDVEQTEAWGAEGQASLTVTGALWAEGQQADGGRWQPVRNDGRQESEDRRENHFGKALFKKNES